MISTVTSKGQVTIPKAVRESLSIRAGVVLDFLPQGKDLVVKVIKPAVRPSARLVKTAQGLRGVTAAPVSEAAVEQALANFP